DPLANGCETLGSEDYSQQKEEKKHRDLITSLKSSMQNLNKEVLFSALKALEGISKPVSVPLPLHNFLHFTLSSSTTGISVTGEFSRR
ncbi:hypothetical protein PIB30_086243, partial [Stylosanthes scabra]|nr:hypothetical protein [Stylosanthes scabra]